MRASVLARADELAERVAAIAPDIVRGEATLLAILAYRRRTRQGSGHILTEEENVALNNAMRRARLDAVRQAEAAGLDERDVLAAGEAEDAAVDAFIDDLDAAATNQDPDPEDAVLLAADIDRHTDRLAYNLQDEILCDFARGAKITARWAEVLRIVEAAARRAEQAS